MRISMLAPNLQSAMISRHIVAQMNLFRQRDDQVRLYLPAPPVDPPVELAGLVFTPTEPLTPSEVYVFHYAGDYPLLASIRERDQGTVFVHDHGAAPKGWLPAHYADVCLVSSRERRQELMGFYGLPPERVHLLPELDQEAAYRAALSELVDQAVTDVWPPSVHRMKDVSTPALAPASPWGKTSPATSLSLVRSQADVMLRDYTVRSRLPLVGGLIAWVRRNVTSHLREPYLDPTLERQVAFNRTVVAWMEQVQARLEELEAQIGLLHSQASVTAADETEERQVHRSGSDEQVDDVG